MLKLLSYLFIIVGGIVSAMILQHFNCQDIEVNHFAEFGIYTMLSASCFGTYLFIKAY